MASIVSLLLAGCGPAPDNGLPAPVATALAELAALCSSVDGIPHTQNAVQRVDLNGDVADDFVLLTESVVCENAPGIFGDRAKGVTLFAGDGNGGAVRAFDDAVYGARLETSAAGTLLWLTTAGAACGQAPVPSFADEHFCERAVVWNPSAARFEYAPLATVRNLE